MKIKKQATMLLTFLFILLAGCCMTATVHAESYMDVTISANTKYQTVIKWKKHSVTKYYVYRANVYTKGDDTNYGKFSKIATISGKSTSYTDKKVKKKHEYVYKIYGYKNGKLTYFNDSASVYTGVAQSLWGEFAETDAAYSTSFIELRFDKNYSSIKPDGLEIQRRVHGTKTYKKIKTISSKYSSYKDKTVKAGKTYDYRFRAYKKIKGKKVYGAYSKAMKKSAVIKGGNFKVSLQAPSSVDSTMVKITIKSNYKYNGKLKIDYLSTGWSDRDNSWLNDIELKKYSYDGSTWHVFSENKPLTLNPGKTIYLLASADTQGSLSEFTKKVGCVTVVTDYNEIPYLMYIHPNSSKATMDIFGEAIH